MTLSRAMETAVVTGAVVARAEAVGGGVVAAMRGAVAWRRRCEKGIEARRGSRQGGEKGIKVKPCPCPSLYEG